MKKITLAFTLFVIAINSNCFAQSGGVHVAAGDLDFSAGKIKEGLNIVLVKDGKGALQFVKKGDTFSEVIYKDATGLATRLITTPAGTGGTPTLDCKSKLPTACFGTANKSFGLCICRPGNTSRAVYTVTFYGSGVYKWTATFQ